MRTWTTTWARLLPLALLVLAPVGLVAQEADTGDEAEAATDDDLIFDDELEQDPPEFFEFDSPAEIEELLSEEWRMLAGEAQPEYDPGNRRDPFLSLIVDREGAAVEGQRPEGVPGLMIGDLEVTGIIKFGQQTVAQVRAADRPVSYLVHEGDRLYDGDVVSIREDEVVFQQIVDDQAALRPFRTVVKKLRPGN